MATTNPGKLVELDRILKGTLPAVELVGLDQYPSSSSVEETGSTYEDNALLKARYYNKLHGLPTVADDSGIEVAALGGKPGVWSARYAGPDASDRGRNEKLLADLKGVAPGGRTARYVCAAAIVWNDDEKVFVGDVEGEILSTPRGEGGFGYDPLFYYPGLGRTFAELSAEEKDRISHRGRAFRMLRQWLADASAGLLDTGRSGDRIESSDK